MQGVTVCRRSRPCWWLAAALGAALLLFVASANAANFSGATGMIQLPTAGALPYGQLEATAWTVDGRFAASVSYGVMEHVEIAVSAFNPGSASERYGLAVKGVVFAEGANNPGFAVGFETDQSYLVASRRLNSRLRAHVGYGYGKLQGLFGGASIALATTSTSGAGVRTPATTAHVEYTPQGDVNVGATMLFTPALSVDIGLLDMKRLAVGVSYRSAF